MPVLRDDPEFPVAGWTWRRVRDVSPASAVCQFCGQVALRYVHHLDHPTAGEIRVGCDCAEDLTGRGGTATTAEKPLRDLARRESVWLTHPDWQTTPSGVTRRIGGRERVAFVHVEQDGLWWSWRVEFVHVRPPSQTYHSGQTFPDAEAAKRDVYAVHFAASPNDETRNPNK